MLVHKALKVLLEYIAKFCYINTTMTLLEQTIERLQSRKGDWAEIARANDVSYSWITKLAQGKIPNPGVLTIERLNSYLRAQSKKTRATN
jgi:predicted transcriptional regulator